MFSKSFYVFLILCGYVNSAEYISSTFVKNVSPDIQVKQQKFPKEKLHKMTSVIKNNDRRTKVISKRGIVMVDSDFDIPSEIYTYENDLDTEDVFVKNEGSGILSGNEEYNEEEYNETVQSTEEDITPMSELQKVTNNASTILTRSTTKAMKQTTDTTDIPTSTNIEGSGDVSLITEEHYSTTEVLTQSYTTTTTTPEYEIQEKLPDICMNSTCDTNDLIIFTSEERISIPEGTNFTLTCKSSNHSVHNMLHWYKSNGSEYFLQTLGTNEQLNLNIPNSKLIHSGIYVCVKQVSKQSCCNIRYNVIIYEVPLYQYHLIIIGLITLAGIIICIFLSVRQSIALKKYTMEFAEKHGTLKNLL